MSDTEKQTPPGSNSIASDADPGPGAQSSADETLINAADQEFLVQCLTHSVGGIQVDLAAVAEARGQKSAMAVKNRLLSLKKRFNLPLVGRNQNGKGIPDATTDGGQAPKTPKKATNRVTKPRTPASGKKTPTKRTPKKQEKSEVVVKEDLDAQEMDAQDLVVQKMDEKPDYGLEPAEANDEGAAGPPATPE